MSVTPDFKYRKVADEYIEPADGAESNNLDGVAFIQVVDAGTITFRHDDGSLSVPVPIGAGQSFALGLDMRNIMATNTSLGADKIIAYMK